MTVTVVEAGFTAGSTTHANLPITTGKVETVAAPENITVEKNYVTNRYEVHATVMSRRVTVCSHITSKLADDCAKGLGCAYGKPIGAYTE